MDSTAGSGRGFDREIRFAVVMYGGVSLAVYMNGIAQELLNMVRATAPLAGNPLEGQFRWGESDLTGTERVYRALAERLRARFIVDLMSGTSAGGINGLYLAKAIVNDRSLDDLRKLWVDQGDIAKLLNDHDSLEGGLPSELLDVPAASLLNGQRFYWQLLDALVRMDDQAPVASDRPNPLPAESPPPYVDELDLFITATDFQGLDLPLQLADKTIDERVYRKLFHFRSSSIENRNDFGEEKTPILAFAARCTASFPAAFPPFKLEDIDPVLQAHPRYARSADRFDSTSLEWKPFFAEYPSGYEKRFFVDGGYLDNKPFEAVVNAFSERHQVLLPAERKLLYIEPDPDRRHRDVDGPRPDVVSALLAVDSLPRVETIRAELDAITRRNRIIARAATLTERLEQDARRNAKMRQPHEEAGDWAINDLQSLIEQHGLAYGGYHRLKVAALSDWLAHCLARARDVERLGADEAKAVMSESHVQVDSWRKKYVELLPTVSPSPNAPAAPPPLTESRLVVDYDVAYRIRRMEFVRLKLREMLRSPERALAVIDLAGLSLPEGIKWEAAWNGERGALIELQSTLQVADRRLLKAQRGCGELEERAENGTLSGALLHALQAFQRQPTDANAKALLDAMGLDIRDELKQVGQECQALLSGTLDPPAGPVDTITRQTLAHFYRHYDDFDLVRFPVAHCLGTSELEGVDVLRVSGADTTLAGSRGASKLAGVKLGHFGAFLDAEWRESDILWGRLDGAERIISALSTPKAGVTEAEREAALATPEASITPAERESWLLHAWTAIIFDHATEKAKRQSAPATPTAPPPAAPMNRTDIVAYVERETAIKDIPAKTTIDLLGRSTAVVRNMLGGVAEKRSLDRNVVVLWLLRLLAVIWGLVEVAIPRSVLQLLMVYWLKLAAISGGLLAGVAVLLDRPGERNIGLLIVGAVLVAGLIGEALRDTVSGGDKRRIAQKWAWGGGLAATFGLGLCLATAPWASGHLGGALPNMPRMADLELARDAHQLAKLLSGCDGTCQARVVDALHGDVWFIFGYVLLYCGIATAARTLATARGWYGWARAARLCIYVVPVAAVADLLENSGLWLSLHFQLYLNWDTWTVFSIANAVSLFTFMVSALKWVLTFIIGSFAVPALFLIAVALLRAPRARPTEPTTRQTRILAPRRPRLFIGHGGSDGWREIKQALTGDVELTSLDVLSNPGKLRTERLFGLLQGCDFAVLVSGQVDGSSKGISAHTIGLIQGRLAPDRFRLLAADGGPDGLTTGVARIDFHPDRAAAAAKALRGVLEERNLLPRSPAAEAEPRPLSPPPGPASVTAVRL